MNAMRSQRLSRAVVLIPPVLLLVCLGLWTVDVLNWDEWVIWTGLLERMRDGAVGLADLIRQQNEQRNVAARLIGLAYYPLFHLNRLPEYATVVGMAAACAGLAAWLRGKTFSGQRDTVTLLAFSALSFSLLQWETFSYGINTSVMMPVLALWTGVCLAWGTDRLSVARLAGMAGAGLVGSFSFANGLFYWLCLTPLVALRAGSRRRARVSTLAWLCLGALVWVLYFTNYAKPEHHPSPLGALSMPLSLTLYFLAYLGGALVGDRNLLPLAIVVGSFGLFLLLSLAHVAWRGGPETRREAWPWFCVAAFTLLSALATAVGRCGLSLGQALESRYATFSSPLWMVLAALFMRYRMLFSPRGRRWLDRGCLGCVAVFLLSTVLAAVVLHNRHPRLERAREALFSLDQVEALRVIFPDPAFLIANMPLYLQRRAGAYRVLPADDRLRPGGIAAGDWAVAPGEAVDGRVHGFVFQGRAAGQAGRLVAVRAGTRVVGLGKVGQDGAWRLFLPESALPAGAVTLTVACIAPDGLTLMPLEPGLGRLVDNPGRATRDFLLARNFFVPGLTHGTDGRLLCGSAP